MPKNIGLRLPADLLARIDALIDKDRPGRSTRTDIMISLLELGLSAGAGEPQDAGEPVWDAIAAIERRVERLELRSQPDPPAAQKTPTAPKMPSQNRPEAASKSAQVSQHPPKNHPTADGGRWLTTSQAAALSAARGGPENGSTLKRWGEQGRANELGLRYCPHGSRNKSLATFEDLRHCPPQTEE